jgi:hypothetical protein
MALAALAALILAPLALADQVVNTIDTTVDPALETVTITAGGSTPVGFYIKTENNIPPGDENGCNATGSAPATVTLSIPSEVTASATSLTFTGCGPENKIDVTFSSSTAGNYTVSVASVTGGRSGSRWETAPAAFTLIVTAPADTTPPVIIPSVSGTLGNNGWYVSDVTVTWTVTDPESEVTSTSGCGETIIGSDTDGVTLTCTATSAGGTSSESVTIKRDATAPTISGSRSPAANAYGWNNEKVTVSFTCDDELSGVASCEPDVTLTGEGEGQLVTGTAVDRAGNSASATVSGINIDKTPPTATGSASPAANAYGWNNTDVTVSFSGTDALSGIDSCSAPVVLSSEGADQSASGTCTDKAGNVSALATVSGINIDKTPPTLTIIVPGPDGDVQPVGTALNFSASDNLSGLAGQPLATLYGMGDPLVMSSGQAPPVGVYRVVVQATDLADNIATSEERILVIYDPSAGFVTGGGWINSPAGAYLPDPTLTGKATFGFVSKYQKGAKVPTGNTEFQFHAAKFTFKSDSYQWLVVAGAKAQYKGVGSVNGVPGYGFLLTAVDGQVKGGGGVDKFRIKIWNLETGVVIYDNVRGAPDDIDAANPQEIAGGSIVIHSN